MEKYAAVILAAGKGTRMNEGQVSPIPKVMFEAAGKPVIHYSVQSIQKAGINKIVLLVGYKKEMVMGYFKDEVEYTVQEEQLGTGHAAKCAKNKLEGKAQAVIIFYGDNPLFKPETIKKLINLYERKQPTIAMLSVIFADPMHWAFGRIIRNEKGEVVSIIEQKDCTPEQLKIPESNPGFYIISADWFWKNSSQIKTNNIQKEYYLTDIVGIARSQGRKVLAMPVSEESEALGINTPEQLKEAEEVIKQRHL